MTTSVAPAVSMRGVDKSFYGVPVLRGVSFEVLPGEVHALAGGNGAGKSTLMKILQGVYQRDAGTVEVFGTPLAADSIAAAQAAGIGMVFQEFSLIPTLTVAQNIYLGDEPLRNGLIDDTTMRRNAASLLARIQVELDPDADLEDLPTAQWQLTEIAKALHQDARVLIMDEPTASLAKHEVDALFVLIERLKQDGISIIYISHRMDEVYRIADRITILRNGANLFTSALSDITPQQIVAGIAGQEISTAPSASRETTEPGDVLLAVTDAHAKGVNGASLELRAGEVVGIAGLMGSGRTELASALFGMNPLTSGSITRAGVELDLSSPRAAIKAGIALVPEDRRLQGLVLEHSVRDNLSMPMLHALLRGGLVAADKVKKFADDLIAEFAVKVDRPEAEVRLLSGGNQQKVVIAKWLGTTPDVLVMDEPTAGVDVGTKAEIVRIVRELAKNGKGIIVISSEFGELIAMCDRFLIMRDGAVVTSIDAAAVTSEVDLELAVQGLVA